MIYIHIPFCRSFCTYCDFYSETVHGCHDAFAAALVKEIDYRNGQLSDDVDTLYIGGGTPSVLPLSVFGKILSALTEAGHGGPYEEFTVEVNPDDIVSKGHSYVEGLLEMGVNRISMGVQSFDDAILRWMNRRHDSATAVRAYRILEETGLENINIDLIFGLPQLKDSLWRETMDKALSISGRGNCPSHVSAYQLSVEPGSALADLVGSGRWKEASEEQCGAQYEALCEVLGKAGYRHYEISNFALPGKEAVHNSAYWRHVPYVGLGPGAHSFGFFRSSGGWGRQWNAADLEKYLDAGRKGDFSLVQEGETLDAGQLSMETVMLGMRTAEGLPEPVLREHCSDGAVDRALACGDLVRRPDGNLRIPENRFFVSDSVIASLI